MGKPGKVAGFILTGFCILTIRYASGEVVGLEPIVVSPFAQLEETSIYSVPSGIHAYTREDIESSGASTLLEFFKKIPAVNVSDYYGTGVKASVDLMGYGDNAGSNVLLLVNGRRTNDIDLSGVDWTQVPLENIERVEILKGSGVVLYGDNASGGVINIITKKPQDKKLNVTVNSKFGSYSLDNEAVEIEKAGDSFSFYVNSSHYGTDGYRENSFYSSDNIYSYFGFKPVDKLSCFIESGYQNYRYGLPGSLYTTDLNNGYSRRDTKNPNDTARMEDRYINSNVDYQIQEDIKISVNSFLRDKNGRDDMISCNNLITDKHIQQKGFKAQLFVKKDVYRFSNNLIVGGEVFQADYSANSNSPTFTDIDRNSLAVFMQNQIKLTQKLSVLMGARYQKEKFTFDYISSSGSIFDDNLKLNEEGYEAGINYQFSEYTNAFLHFARGFRIPKTDEYFVTWPSASIKTTLIPQRSKTYSLGLNSKINDRITVNTDIFRSNVDNELYYDDLTWNNENYPEIERTGFNISTSIVLIPSLTVEFGYRYIDAEFEKGDHKGKKVPFVPENLFKFDFKYSFKKKLFVYFDASYRDSVYRINDLNNIAEKLDSYWNANLKVDYKLKDSLTFYCGINNLFNEKYSEYGSYGNSSGNKAIYPSPGINYYMGLKHTF